MHSLKNTIPNYEEWNESILKVLKKYQGNKKSIDYSKTEKEKLKKMKNGIYEFCDDERTIYIGMVSKKPTASVYARLYRNGSAAHAKKKWFKENGLTLYFCDCPKLKLKNLRIFERILIKELKPVYNDLHFTEKDVQNILNNL